MPSKSRKRTTAPALKRPPTSAYLLFWPLLGLVWFLWLVYRTQLQFAPWFDEIIGKAIFFGLPVLLYMSSDRSDVVYDSLRPEKMRSGLLLGIALGGIYGFVATLTGDLVKPGVVMATPLYNSGWFWWEFFLALMTGFWETLFFFSWVMGVVAHRWRAAGPVVIIGITTAVFLVFHLANTFLRFDSWEQIFVQILLLGSFALGQALIFWRWRNFYTLVISHAVWGMALLVHLL